MRPKSNKLGDYQLPRLRLQSAAQQESVFIKDYQSGASYTGRLAGNIRVKYGVFIWPNGARYVGEYDNNLRQGQGTQEWPDGSTYEGLFKDDMRHGSGNHTWPNGEKYSGDYCKDRRHGSGTYSWPSGTVYTGSFYMNMKEGYGQTDLPDHSVFKGLYRNDERFGPGVLTYTDGHRDIGLWLKGHLLSLCTPIDGCFTMADHSEFIYRPEEHIQKVYPEIRQVTRRLSDFENRLPMTEEFFPEMFGNISRTDVGKYESIDLSTLSYDQFEFNEIFFKNQVDLSPVDSFNNSPLIMDLQKHILTYKFQESHSRIQSTLICTGHRSDFDGDPGQLEEAALKFLDSSRSGDLSTVKFLLRNGSVYVDVSDKNGCTALLLAAERSQHDVINCLLDNGADVNRLNNEGLSPLAVCHVLYYDGTTFKTNLAELHVQSVTQRKEELLLREQLGSIVDGEITGNGDGQEVGMTTEGEEGETTEVTDDCKQQQDEPEPEQQQQQQQQPPQEQEDTDEVNETTDIIDGNNPAHSINNNNNNNNDNNLPAEDMSNNPDRVTEATDFESDRSLANYDIVITNNILQRSATALSQNNRIISGKYNDKDRESLGTARLMALDKSIHDNMEVTIQQLLRRGADPNASHVPMPVLFFAMKAGNVNAVRLLLLQNAATTIRLPKEQGGLAPLHIAVCIPGESGIQITDLLLKAGADPNIHAFEYDKEQDPMDEGDNSNIDETQQRALTELSKDTVIQSSTIGGRTPLHYVCERDDDYKMSSDIVKLLLKAGADPNVISQGQSPLSTAIRSGNDIAIDDLLSFNADPNLRLSHGAGSALCMAVSTEYEYRRTIHARIAIVDKLVSSGAGIIMPIIFGSPSKKLCGTAVDYAYFMYYQDRRVAHMPYHALTPAERDTFNARREFLSHIGDILRDTIIRKEYRRLVMEETDGPRSVSPSAGFLYTGSGANSPIGVVRPSQVKFEDSSSSGPSDPETSAKERMASVKGGIITIDGTKKQIKLEDIKRLMKDGRLRIRKPLYKYCYECGRAVGVRLTACTRCKEVYYCSKTCKVKAWNSRHKDECIRLANKGQRSKTTTHNRIDSPTMTTNACHKGGTKVNDMLSKAKDLLQPKPKVVAISPAKSGGKIRPVISVPGAPTKHLNMYNKEGKILTENYSFE